MIRIKKYEHTIYASYFGYITQAIVNNFVPLLFVTLAADMQLTLDKITMITTVNFAVQLLVDLIAAGFVDKIGYRASVVAAHVFAAAGLLGLSVFPSVFTSEYMGLMTAVILYAIGGGIIEVVISPIVEACPTEKKEAAMSLLHSFYCWGHVAVVILSTLFFTCFGIENWRILSCIWAVVPLANCFYFLMVPLYPIVSGHEKMSLGGLFRRRIFWLLLVLMVCAGASEQAMSQWASTFAESGLSVSKTIGDLAGPCAFAILMGTARALYGKFGDRLPLRTAMAGSAVLCIGCYLTAILSGSPLIALIGCAACGFTVGIFWPGTFSMAASALPAAGTAMYAFMALAGDVGCSAGPTVVGLIAAAQENDLKAGLAAAIVFPVLILIGTAMLRKRKSS